MIFKEVLRWLPDDMPKSTYAVVVVSICGNVIKRLPYVRWNKKNNGYSFMKEKIYKQSNNRGKQRNETLEKKKKFGSYMHVEINNTVYSVHRLVATAYIDNPELLDCVNHKNGIRNDNRADNLEWVTNSENVKHAWKNGLRDVSRMRKLPNSEIEKIIEERKKGISFEKIAKQYGMRGESIRYRINQYENGIHS